MRLTTARYYTPSGRSIQAKGIDPDIVVEAAKIEQREKGDSASRPRQPKDKTAKPDDTSTSEMRPSRASVDPSLIGTADDYQLARAVDMLRGISLFNGRVIN